MKTRVFLVGAPRSGTSMLLDLITGQPELGWVSNRLDKDPEHVDLARKERRFDWPLLGEYWFERRYDVKHLTYPADSHGFWEHYLPGFKVDLGQPRIPGPEEVSDEDAVRCRDAVEDVQALQNKTFFVAHYSGFPRVAMMRKVFPEAKFIQLQRDPRSVAIRLSREWEQHPDQGLWPVREEWKALMPVDLRQRLEEIADTPLNMAGVMVRWWHELYRQELDRLPETDRLSLAYADLLAKPDKTLKRAVKFLGLEPSPRLKRYIRFHQIQERNKRMSKELSDEESAQLEKAVKKLTPTAG